MIALYYEHYFDSHCLYFENVSNGCDYCVVSFTTSFWETTATTFFKKEGTFIDMHNCILVDDKTTKELWWQKCDINMSCVSKNNF